MTAVPMAELTVAQTVARAARTARPTVAQARVTTAVPMAALTAARGTAQPTEAQGPTAAPTVVPTAGRADRH